MSRGVHEKKRWPIGGACLFNGTAHFQSCDVEGMESSWSLSSVLGVALVRLEKLMLTRASKIADTCVQLADVLDKAVKDTTQNNK